MDRLLAVLLLVSLLSAPVRAADFVAVARNSAGEVYGRDPATGVSRKLVEGARLDRGWVVKTGKDGWVRLELADGSTLVLANNTELELVHLRLGTQKKEGLLSLRGGKIRARIVRLAGQQADIRVKSRTAVAGVKGTEFLMLTKGPANVFFGNVGVVAVRGEGEESSILDDETMTQTTRGHRPIAPVTVERGTPLERIRSVFNAATGDIPPPEWAESDRLPDIIARWDINYAHYLVDRGDYLQAAELLQVAYDLAGSDEIRADALLELGSLRGRFLQDPAAALEEYSKILEEYPRLPQAERALFSSAQILFDRNDFGKAREALETYLARYPAGLFRDKAGILLKLIEEESRRRGGSRDAPGGPRNE